MKNAARYSAFCLLLVFFSISFCYAQQDGSRTAIPDPKASSANSNEILSSLRNSLREALIELEASATRYNQLWTQAQELTTRLTQALTSQKTLEESLKISAEQLTEARNERISLEEKSRQLASELRKALKESDESRKRAEEARLLITKLEADLNAASGISTGFLRPALNELEESVKKDAQKIQSLTLQRNLALGGCALFALGSLALGVHALIR
ncbi:MAG: hypothetical protein LBK13_04945 [Spirochaetales bacterium]|jgi:DNA repair exonuclease SbcCD ATPase subunit|nr:hypothetical protein [Spirochaetales bacterium]